MRVDVVMPQMGESIAEGTISRWLKQPGERVSRDEPLLEISTDKVDAEIPSPAAGIVVETRVKEGQTVAVNSIVAVIETEAAATEKAGAAKAAAPPQAAPSAPKPAPQAAVPPASPSPSPSSAPRHAPAPVPQAARPAASDQRFVSPVVRKIAAEHGLDPALVPGSGSGGRVTKKDIEAFLDAGGARAQSAAPGAAAPAAVAAPAAALAEQPDAPAFVPGEPVVRVAMTPMRKKIAEHMIESRRTSAHVHSVFEVDMTRVVRLRERYKASYVERHGTALSYMAFFIKAVCDGLRAWPILNASVDGESIVYHKDLNIGVAVALDWGLIVPVIRRADEMSLAGISKRVADLAERARTKKLNPDEVQGGTFTLTNPGQFGGLYGLPIINQPQVAILGIGGIKRRPVVIDEGIAIRSMMILSMSYDHRVVDGAVADRFLARVQHTLEQFDEALL